MYVQKSQFTVRSFRLAQLYTYHNYYTYTHYIHTYIAARANAHDGKVCCPVHGVCMRVHVFTRVCFITPENVCYLEVL